MRYLPKAKIDEIYEKGVATIAWGEVRGAVLCDTKQLSVFFRLSCDAKLEHSRQALVTKRSRFLPASVYPVARAR